MRRPDSDAATPVSDAPTTFAGAIAHLPHDEQVRLRATLDEQRRTMPERVVEASLIRAMAHLLASILMCPTCECRMFMPAEDMPGPSCDWRTADAATLEASIAPFRPVCPLCEPERALATIHHRYPETRP